ncbi:MAG: hypothetical protein ACJ8DW_00980, partial [Microvirga sp.]
PGPTGAGSVTGDTTTTRSRYGRPCPGHPDRTSAALQTIGITGTRPAMSRRVQSEGARAERRKPIRERENQPGTVIPGRLSEGRDP